MKKELTAHQKVFIAENRFIISMVDMASQLEIDYNRVRKYMIKNNLRLTRAQAQNLRIKKYKETCAERSGYIETKPKPEVVKQTTPPKRHWVSDPWNYNLNTITMSGSA